MKSMATKRVWGVGRDIILNKDACLTISRQQRAYVTSRVGTVHRAAHTGIDAGKAIATAHRSLLLL
jgi:hypothetical protein